MKLRGPNIWVPSRMRKVNSMPDLVLWEVGSSCVELPQDQGVHVAYLENPLPSPLEASLVSPHLPDYGRPPDCLGHTGSAV